MGLGLTLTDDLLKHLGPQAPSHPGTCWEVGRLVLDEAHRSDVNALRQCLFLSLDYACTLTRVDNLYASCTHVLGRLYRRFAFNSFAADVPLAGTDKRYTLIHGYATEVLASLSGRQVTAH
ncbi:N-acetyltransferase [Ramlibacter rhizophilus]|uniref:N-acetyltransferase n=2 Tax=Ramlibacter rhizophilus TaxID=1781167 RepID=A0A4Z0BJ25_9BURK|nr:N-acetyltransferase [Ramlibacter rhizophilus]